MIVAVLAACAGCAGRPGPSDDFRESTERALASTRQDLIALKSQSTQNEFRIAQLTSEIESLKRLIEAAPQPATQPTTLPSDSTTMPARMPAP